MKKTLKKYIDIDGTDFLTIIKKQETSGDYFPILENDIVNISKTKKVNLDNIQELFTYLVYSDENYKHYYEGLKTFIYAGMCATCAVETIENNISEDEKMFSFLEEYFDYEFTIDGMVRVNWKDKKGENNEI